MAFTVTFDLVIAEVLRAIERATSLDNQVLLDIVIEDVQLQFASGGSFDAVVGEVTRHGVTWEALAPFTIAQRQRLGFTGLKLQRTEALRRSMIPGDSNNRTIRNDSTIELTSLLPYANQQDKGSGRIPARPFTTFTPQLEMLLGEALEGILERELQGI